MEFATLYYPPIRVRVRFGVIDSRRRPLLGSDSPLTCPWKAYSTKYRYTLLLQPSLSEDVAFMGFRDPRYDR